ncbi:FadR/GntR family transcriptional regulator [Comamonas aquatica]|uniref:FadR/GntR family transcriptional regulator n=1 Tax=Comamonas aquatica TaxID=225991 RepID=UPI0005A9A3A8|nr:FadR/GntR family transcriptional regulator [Comamonas aquatica]MDH0495176.1 FadR family transcriptional regulator [Comamonas aquatica]
MTVTAPKTLPSPRRLYREVAEQIRSKIENGSFAPNTRLPAERELSEMLGISRSSVREALIVLEINGYVDIRGGSGVYVCPFRPNPANTPATPLFNAADMGPFEIMETRVLLEPECAALAALHATAQQRNMLRSLHAAMELVHTPQVNRDGSCGKYDRLLHLTIAQACGNAALASAVAHLWELSDHSPVFQRLDQQPVSAQHWGVSWREHSRFVEAIVSGDTVRARHGMAHHLLSVMDRIRNNPAWLV